MLLIFFFCQNRSLANSANYLYNYAVMVREQDNPQNADIIKAKLGEPFGIPPPLNGLPGESLTALK